MTPKKRTVRSLTRRTSPTSIWPTALLLRRSVRELLREAAVPVDPVDRLATTIAVAVVVAALVPVVVVAVGRARATKSRQSEKPKAILSFRVAFSMKTTASV